MKLHCKIDEQFVKVEKQAEQLKNILKEKENLKALERDTMFAGLRVKKVIVSVQLQSPEM